MPDLSSGDTPVVAHITRDDRIESVHRGIGVVVDSQGRELTRTGDAGLLVYPRSTLKPLQALALLEAGAPLSPLEIALSAASHQGTSKHQRAIEEFLQRHQLSTNLLACPADWPLGEKAKADMIFSGQHHPTPLAMNCSGKHAGFLACCQHKGWDLEGYLDPHHPLQVWIRDRLEALSGETVAHTTPDGCGAPLHQLSLVGLARATAQVTAGVTPESQAFLEALAAHSWAIAGEGHPNTVMIDALGGVAKIGAEGLVVIGLAGGPTAAVKILDGSMRATTPFALALLKRVGAIDADIYEDLLDKTSAKIYGGSAVTGGLSIVI